MKLNDHFFGCKNKLPAKEPPFRCFKVSCAKCGSLRLILIAEMNSKKDEIVIIHGVASRKNYCCGLHQKFPARKAINGG